MQGQRGEYYTQYYSLWNDTSWFYLIPEAEVILALVAVAVVVVVVEVISMRTIVEVEKGGDYLDTSSSRSRSSSIAGSPAWSLSCGQLTVL
jgi:hypothetical protein